jgi:outer membrane protein assembly factor BamB
MKLLWQNKFDGFDLVRTSPLYYKATAEKEERVVNCYFFDRGVGIKSVSFDAQNGQIIDYRKDGKINKKSSTEKHNSHDLTLDDFIFGEYTISHHGEWGYACKKNDQLLWKKSLKGYLYTEIILDRGNIVFGTAGQGGHFYSLNINTGEIVFDFNTRGTSIFFDVNNNYYFCATDKKNTQIYRIDHDGNVLETIEIEGAYYDYECLFEVCDDLLCVMTLKKKRKGYDEIFSPIFYCVQL